MITLGELVGSGPKLSDATFGLMLKAKRLASTFARIAAASPRHAATMCTVIARGLRGDPAQAPRDIASLLALFHELSVETAGRIDDAATRPWLEQQARGGKVATMRRALLAR